MNATKDILSFIDFMGFNAEIVGDSKGHLYAIANRQFYIHFDYQMRQYFFGKLAHAEGTEFELKNVELYRCYNTANFGEFTRVVMRDLATHFLFEREELEAQKGKSC